MSSFLSPKYLRYRGSGAVAPIEHDLLCTSCGYNLRGLNYGRNCPECGSIIQMLRMSPDLLLACDETGRNRWRWGLSLAAAAVFISMAVETLWLSSIMFPLGLGTLDWIVFVVLGNLLLWLTAVLLITPPRIDALGGWARAVRLAARILTALWLAAFIWLIWAVPSGRPLLLAIFCVFLGSFGSLLVLYLMLHVARTADLESADRRLVTALWLLPLSTVLASFLPFIPWAALFAISVVLVIPLLVLTAWLWGMTMTALALLEMLNHVRWTEIHRDFETQREQRMAAVRAALDGEAQSVLRPLPRAASGEIGMED